MPQQSSRLTVRVSVFKLAIAMIATADRPFPTYKRFLPGGTSSWGVMHVVNRTAGGQLLFGPEEKEHFRSLVFSAAHFCGLEVLTWTCLDNHFHLLLNVPSEAEGARLRAEISEEEIFARMKQCYSKAYLKDTQQRLKKFRSSPGEEALAEAIMRRLRAQMYDISAYMHIVQRRFSEWFNKRKGRRGTLWQGRFRSTLVEASGEALLKTAAYIDLNAVRAQIIKDPKDYRWCGYAEALGGSRRAQRGLCRALGKPVDGWKSAGAAAAYRCLLHAEGREVKDAQNEKVVSRGVTAESARAVLAAKGKLSPAELVRLRVRYFTDGVVLGSKAFVEGIFESQREHFGPKRKQGARRMTESEAPFYTLRQLRLRPLG